MSKELSEEMQEMLSVVTGEAVAVAEKEPEPESEPEPEPKEVVDEQESEQEDKEPDESLHQEDSEQTEEQPEADAEESAEPEMVSKEQYDRLLEQLRLVSAQTGQHGAGLLQPSLPAQQQPTKTDQPKQPEMQFPVTSPEISPITDEEYEAAISSREGFDKIVRKRIVEDVRKGVLENVASVSQNVVAQYLAAQEMARAFYEENPDLSEFKDYCRLRAQQIHAAKPTMTDQEVLAETAQAVRNDLGLTKKAKAPATIRKKASPTFARANNTTKKKPGRKTISDEFNVMRDL